LEDLRVLSEPPTTAYDLRFSLLGIPVRVHPFFWLVGVILGASGDRTALILWPSVLFVSILVHEMGHALIMRYFGLRPRVVLYSFGGLAIPDSDYSPFGGSRPRIGPLERILYTLAGPGAGFMLAALVVMFILLTGGHIDLDLAKFPLFWREKLAVGSPELQSLVSMLLYVNIFWGLVNLLPVYPLDGGQIARELMTLKDPWKGIVNSLWLSVFTSAAVAGWALLNPAHIFIALMFGMFAYSSYATLQRGSWH
jgi:Zn-dependent protease